MQAEIVKVMGHGDRDIVVVAKVTEGTKTVTVPIKLTRDMSLNGLKAGLMERASRKLKGPFTAEDVVAIRTRLANAKTFFENRIGQVFQVD